MVSEVFFEDNISMMKRYPDNFFDLAIPDIEYCIGASKPSKKNKSVKQDNGTRIAIKQSTYTHKEWDFKKSSDEYFKQLFRVSKKQIIWGGNYYGFQGGYLVWDKLNGECDQYGCEMAWLSFSKRTDIVYYLWSGMMQGVYCGKDVRRALVQQGNKKLNEKRIHETQKPVVLYKWVLNEYAKPGYKILDTHMGSQNSRKASWDLGFDYWGCENDQEHFLSGCNSFQEFQSQQKLF